MITIPIVFAANDDYAPYLGVAISSLIRFSSPDNIYIIHVLESDIRDAHKEQIANLAVTKLNIQIEFKHISKKMLTQNIGSVNHLSVETTYRLLMPEIFSEYEKVLYLDTDIVIRHDVTELFAENVVDCAVACARAWLLPDLAKYVKNTLDFPVDDYFNPGVMLINIPIFRKMSIGKLGLEMLSKRRYFTQDQDVLNLLCRGNVKYLDPRWNVEWGHATGMMGEAVFDDSRHNQLDSVNDPHIVHYSTCYKPWAHPELPMAEYFWQVARQTVFYEEIVMRNSAVLRDENDIFRWFVFPWRLIAPGSRIVIYGGGVVGKTFCKQIEKTQYCNIVAVCDKFPDKVTGLSIPIVDIDTLKNWPTATYDAILIAIKLKERAAEIRSALVELGISDNKIIWANPLRKGIMELDSEGRICQ